MHLSFIDGKGTQHYTEWPNCTYKLEKTKLGGTHYLDHVVLNAEGLEVFRIPAGLVIHVITGE
jgi:uncharacterized protein (DUF39 family)